MAGIVWLETVSIDGSVCHVGRFLSYVVKFYCCWMWQIWNVFHVEDCGVSSVEYRVHLVCREFLCVHSWWNGTRCRDAWCECVVVSFPFSLAGFWGFHPYMHALVFIRKTFLWLVPDVSLLACFLIFFFNSKREERWERKARGRYMVCKVWKHRAELFTKNNHHKFKYFQVKLWIYLRGLEAQAKPHKIQVQSTWVLWGVAYRLINPIDPNTCTGIKLIHSHCIKLLL